MNSFHFEKIKEILLPLINDDVRVMDLCCGEDSIFNWLKKSHSNMMLLSPDDVEHIKSENPFVSYNNFLNDERKVPTNKKADVILMMGPLYHMQSQDKRQGTLKEVKRLLSDNGKIVTLGTYDRGNDNTKPAGYFTTPKTEKNELEEAGFRVESVTKIYSDKKDKKVLPINGADCFMTVAGVKPVPKPVLGVSDIPPEVIIRIPDRIKEVKKSIDSSLTFGNSNPNSVEEQKKEIASDVYNSVSEIKPSIDYSLQHNISTLVRKSIDPSIQPELKSSDNIKNGIKINLPVLPDFITDINSKADTDNSADIDTDNSNIEIKSDNIVENSTKEIKTDYPELLLEEKQKYNADRPFEKKSQEIMPSIDSNLVMRSEMSNIMKVDKLKEDCRKIHSSIDDNLKIREDKSEVLRIAKIKEEYSKVHASIDKSLQMRIPKINPKYAKPKSRKKGTRNYIPYHTLKR